MPSQGKEEHWLLVYVTGAARHCIARQQNMHAREEAHIIKLPSVLFGTEANQKCDAWQKSSSKAHTNRRTLMGAIMQVRINKNTASLNSQPAKTEKQESKAPHCITFQAQSILKAGSQLKTRHSFFCFLFVVSFQPSKVSQPY